MSYESTKNIYDDGNIPDSDLPERTGSDGQNRSDNPNANDYHRGGQNGYHDNEDPDYNPDGAPEQHPLTWVTPPVLLSKPDTLTPNAPGLI